LRAVPAQPEDDLPPPWRAALWLCVTNKDIVHGRLDRFSISRRRVRFGEMADDAGERNDKSSMSGVDNVSSMDAPASIEDVEKYLMTCPIMKYNRRRMMEREMEMEEDPIRREMEMKEYRVYAPYVPPVWGVPPPDALVLDAVSSTAHHVPDPRVAGSIVHSYARAAGWSAANLRRVQAAMNAGSAADLPCAWKILRATNIAFGYAVTLLDVAERREKDAADLVGGPRVD
jgi:hypothetical protein